jgi:nitroreductase
MDALEAMRGRRSTRAYLDQPVARATVESILDAARWAPSGVNAQPWQVAVVSGAIKQKISTALLAARQNNEPERPDYTYYPKEWVEPYKTRRRTSGLALYRALNIGKDDADARLKAWNNNYHFFGAPVGLLFFIDHALSQGSWVDLGMFIQNVMLAARAHGLETCPQASLAEYPDIVRNLLGIPDTRALVCGMALGYADAAHPVNGYRTERESVSAFTQWYE